MIDSPKSSIRKKLTLVVASYFLLFITAFLMITYYFFDDYYIYRLESQMKTFSQSIIESGDFDYESLAGHNELAMVLLDMQRISSFHYEVIDRNFKIYLSSKPDFNTHSLPAFPENLSQYIENNRAAIHDKGSDYVVIKNAEGDEGYIMHTQPMGDHYYLIVSKRIDDLYDGLIVANQFFFAIGVFLTILWVAVTYLLSKQITDPIIQISKQAQAIAALDFQTRYLGDDDDEIGRLGHYINQISNELENRMNELKKKNHHLKDDMDSQRHFLASISHEFKSPVGIIKGYAESIKLNYYKNEEEKNKLVDRILHASDQLTSLVEDIIMLTMMDKRTFKLAKTDLNLSQLLLAVCRERQVLNTSSLIHLHTDLEEHIYYSGDALRLRQIFDNLLTNAYRYTTAPWQCHVSMKEEKGSIELTFKNTCLPMDQKDLDQIFSPFYRFEKSHNKETGGHGLGLSVVKALVEAHGGRVQAFYANGAFSLVICFTS